MNETHKITNINDIKNDNIKQIGNDISQHIVHELLNDIIDTIIDRADRQHYELIIEKRIMFFKELLDQTSINVNSDSELNSYEIYRYITLCGLLQSFITKLFAQSIDTTIRDRIKRMFYNIYKTSVYHKEFRKFIVLLRLNQISFSKYRSVKTVTILNAMGHYMHRQLQFINSILKQRALFNIISKKSFDDLICKLIFICTIIIRFSST